METKKIVLYSFGVGFLAGLILFFNGVVHAQDNNTTEITPPAITEYVPNKLEQTEFDDVQNIAMFKTFFLITTGLLLF